MLSQTRLVTTLFAAAALCACSSMSSSGTSASAGAMPGVSQWSGILAPQAGGTVKGNASATVNGDGTSAMASINGAAAGEVHPWHIHLGQCGDNGAVVGAGSAYPVLSVGADGSATASAKLAVALNPSTKYYVNIHKSPTEMGTIVSCGNLNVGM